MVSGRSGQIGGERASDLASVKLARGAGERDVAAFDAEIALKLADDERRKRELFEHEVPLGETARRRRVAWSRLDGRRSDLPGQLYDDV